MSDEGVGTLAHAAVTQALKAAIAASGRRYRNIHDLQALRQQFLEIHPDNPCPEGISPGIYQQYRDYGANHPAVLPITAINDHQALVHQEVKYLLTAARQSLEQEVN